MALLLERDKGMRDEVLWQHGTTTGWTHAGDWVVAGTGLSMGTGRGGGVWSNFRPSRRRLGSREGMIVHRAVSLGGWQGWGSVHTSAVLSAG